MLTAHRLELYDIHSVSHIPLWQSAIFYTLVAFAAVLVIFAIGIMILIYYRGQSVPEKPPGELAISQLKQLLIKPCPDQFDGRLCYFFISDVLKQYLHKQHNLDTLGKTDEELIHYLKKTKKLSKEHIDNIQTIYKGCVLIRFAHEEALAQQIFDHVNLGIKIVEETMPYIDNTRHHWWEIWKEKRAVNSPNKQA